MRDKCDVRNMFKELVAFAGGHDSSGTNLTKIIN